MAALPAPILPRIGALLRLLGSDQDGEALGAARALRRTLGGVGLDLHDLAGVIECASVKVARCDAGEPPTWSMAHDRSRRTMLADHLRRGMAMGIFGDWDRSFALSIIGTISSRKGKVSPKQIEHIDRLLAMIWGATP